MPDFQPSAGVTPSADLNRTPADDAALQQPDLAPSAAAHHDSAGDVFLRIKSLVLSPAGLFFALLLYVGYSRIWDLSVKVMHHDESLFAYYGYWLFKGRGYDYQPILHGPVLQYVSAFFFFLFGDDQWTMRMPSLVGGLLMFPVAWCWRRYLGGGMAAVVAVTALIAFSPSISFYSRFLRNDVPYLTVTMACALCLLRLMQTGSAKYVWGSVLGALLMFSMMESSIFFFAACVGFLATLGVIDLLVWRGGDSAGRQWPEWLRDEVEQTRSRALIRRSAGSRQGDGTVVIGWALLAGALATLLCGWLYLRIFADTLPIWKPFQEMARARGYEMSRWLPLGIAGVLMFGGWVVIAATAIHQYRAPGGRFGLVAWFCHAFWRNRWHAVAAVAVAVGIYEVLFTTFFTFTRTASFDHTARDFRGPEMALTPVQIYKNTWDYWWDQHKLHRIKGPFHYYLPILFLYELPILVLCAVAWVRAIVISRRRWLLFGALVGAHVVMAAGLWAMGGLFHAPIDWAMMDKKFHLESPAHFFIILIFAQLLVVVAPLLFLQGRRAASFLTYWGITSLFAYSYAGEKVPWLVVHSVGPLALLAAAELVRLWRGSSARRRMALAVAGVCGLFYQAHNNHLLLFVHPWSPAERLVFNHTSPDIEKAVEMIHDIGQKTNFGEQLPIYMQGEMAWPMHWYLRDYTNITPSVNESAETTTRPVVMVDWQMAGLPNLQENYHLRRMKVREWWEPPMLDLGALADVYLFFTPSESRRGGELTIRYADMMLEWRKLWHYLAYREIWIDPANPAWSNGDNEFAFGVRKDLPETLQTYPWLAVTPKRPDVPHFSPF